MSPGFPPCRGTQPLHSFECSVDFFWPFYVGWSCRPRAFVRVALGCARASPLALVCGVAGSCCAAFLFRRGGRLPPADVSSCRAQRALGVENVSVATSVDLYLVPKIRPPSAPWYAGIVMIELAAVHHGDIANIVLIRCAWADAPVHSMQPQAQVVFSFVP